MPGQEVTGKREGPEIYSNWHREPNLPKWCYMIDGDWFEYRGPSARIVAYIETICTKDADPWGYTPMWRSTKGLLHGLMRKKFKIPVYVVWYNNECTHFTVLRIHNNWKWNEKINMTEDEYKEFIKKL